MDPEDAFRLLAAQHSADGRGLTPAQVAPRLREYYDMVVAGETHTFVRGDMIRHRMPDMAQTRHAHLPAIFIEYLDNPVNPVNGDVPPGMRLELDDLTSMAMSRVLDCTILVMSPVEGAGVRYFLANSKEYAPYREDHPVHG